MEPCTSGGTGTSTDITGLVKNQSYTYKAYGASTCQASDWLGVEYFKTLPAHVLEASEIKQTTAKLTLVNVNVAWKHRQTAGPGTGTCTNVASGTEDAVVTGLTANTSYTFTAYRDGGCTEGYLIDWVDFTTLPDPPKKPTALSATARIEGAELSWTSGDGSGSPVTHWEYQVKSGATWGSWTEIPGSDASTTSYTVPSLTGGSSHQFKVRAVNLGGDGAASDASTAVTILVKPSVGLTLSTTTLAENAATATVTVTAQFSNSNTFVSDKTVTVTVGGSGTATSGTDYAAVSDFDITISANSSSGTGTFSLDPTDDAVFEGSETITVAGASTGLTVTSTSLTLTDNDNATVTVNDASGSEGDDITFTVTLDNAVQGGLTVTPSQTNGTTADGDYTANTTALSFTGTANETKTFTVSTTEDSVFEGNETFTVGLAVSNAPSGVTATDTGTGTINNDDAAAVTINDAEADEGNNITFTVTLSAAVQDGLTVTPSFTNSTAETTDYTTNTTALSFTGTANETETFTVSTAEDAVVEANETFTVGLSVSKSGITATDTGTGTINNDDNATVTVNDSTASEGDGITFTVTLSAAVEDGLTVTPSQTNGTAGSGDYTANTSALTFAGTANETETFTVSTTEDSVFEGDETFTVGLTVSNAPSGVTSSDTGTGTIDDDDAAAVTVGDARADEGDAMTFTVTLSAAVQGGLTVTPSFTDVSATKGTDYTANTSALTFTGTASETKTFTVSTTEDAVVESDETFTVSLAVSNAPSGVTATDTGTGTIDDDDGTNATLTVNDASASEGDAITFTVSLSKAVQGGLTVTPSFTNGTAASTDYTANTTALTFTGTANETKTFTVSTTEDAVVEGAETFTVGLTTSNSGVTATDTGTGTINNDDNAAVTVNDASASEGEGITFTVTLDKAVQGGLTVTPSYTNGTAETADYTANTTALTFSGTANETETFTVSTTEDAVFEGDETFTVGLTVSNAPSGVTSTDTGEGTIDDDDAAAVTVDDAEADEGDDITFTVTLSAAVEGGLTVTPSFTNGTAASTDYTANTTALSFTGTANETKTFTVSTTEDAVVEGAETFTVGLTASNSGVTANDTGTGTINNDDNATVTVNDASASEGDAITFTVTLSAAVQGGLTVTPSQTNGTTADDDYTANTTALTFTGTANETKTFTVSTTEDTVFEGTETFTVGLSVSGAPSGVTFSDTGTGTINDDDTATVTVNNASASEGDAITFTVTLDKAVQGSLTVTPSYTNGTAASTDYTANTTALTFSGTANETKTFTVSTTEDAVVEGAETFTVGLTASKSGVTATDTGTGTINNDDAAAVTVEDAKADEGDAITFTVTLDKAVQGGLTVTPSYTDGTATKGTDYTANTTALTFSGTANETKTFTVSTTEDAVVEGDETFTVGLSVSGAPSGVTSSDTGTGTIEDDDAANATVTVNDASASEGGAITFTVSLSKAVQGGLTVTPSYTNGTAASTDYTANTTALSFTGTANETKTFTVSTTEDAVVEANEAFTVGLSVSNSGVTATDTGTGTINNDDNATVTVNDANADEGDAMTFTVTLDKAVQGGLTVTPSFTDVSATKGTDYTANTTALTFTGTANETKTFTVSTTQDAVVEADETFTVNLAVSNAPSGVTATGTGTGTINNDDANATVTVSNASASEGDAMTFTVSLSRAVQGGLTVTPSYTNGTAASTDYTANATALIYTGTANEQKTFTVSTTEDAVVEGDETFTVSLSVSKSGITVTGTGTGTINNDDNATVTVDDAEASEGDAITFTVTLDKAVQGGLTVTPSQTNGTAGSGDYTANTTALTFTGTANETETFTVSTIEDAVVEADETFTVNLAVSNAPSGVTATDTGTGTIKNDDSAPDVRLAVSPESLSEAASATTITVTAQLSSQNTFATDKTITVSVGGGTATAGTDYETVSDFDITIRAGQTSGTGTFTLTPKQDNVTEGNETIIVSGTATGLTVQSHPITLNDHTGSSSQKKVMLEIGESSLRIAEGASATTVTVTATMSDGVAVASAQTVTVSVGGGTATQGEDYVAVPDFNITIPAGQTSGTGTFTLTVLQDDVVEEDETIEVAGRLGDIPVVLATIVIADDDDDEEEEETPEEPLAVKLSVRPSSVGEDASATTVTVTAALADGGAFPSARTVTVSVGGGTATPGSDYTAVADLTLSIAAGQSEATATFTLTPVDDSMIEGIETIRISGSGADIKVTGTTLRLRDDDAMPEVDLSVEPARLDEAASPTTVTVTASWADSVTFLEDRTVTVSIGGGTATRAADYEGTQDIEVTIAAGRTSGTATFTLAPTDDSLVEGDETIVVSGAAEGLTVHGTEITLGDDDEIPDVGLSVDPAQVDEGVSSAVVTVTAAFSNGSTFAEDRTVAVSLGAGGATPGTDYAAVSDIELVVTAGRTSGTATFMLTPTDDRMVEGDETIMVSGTSKGLHVTGTVITLSDDDEMPEVDLSIDPATLSEGAAATKVTVTATFSGSSTLLEDRTVTVSLDDGGATPGTDYATVSDIDVVVAAGRTSGKATFTLTPTDDRMVEGDETIVVSGTANGLTVHGTAITLSDDDEIPEVVLGMDPTKLSEGAAATTVTVTAIFANGSTLPEDRTVTVSLDAGSATMGADYAAVSEFGVVVAAGRTSGTTTFTLTPTDDSVVEGDETILVSGAADGLTVHGTEITLGDDDEIPEVDLSVDPAQVDEGASAALVTVTAVFSNASTFAEDRTVTVSVGGGTADPGADHFLVPDFNVTISAGAASGTATFTLMPMDDGVVESDETIAVSGVSEGLTVHDAMLTLLDDDLEEREQALKLGLAGIGRTIATQAVDAIGARFDAASRVSRSSASDSHAGLNPFAVAGILQAGGFRAGGLHGAGLDAGAAYQSDLYAQGAGLAGATLGGSTLGAGLGGAALGGLAGGRMAHPTADGLVSMSLGGGQTGGTGGWTLWASGARTDFSGRPSGISMDGSMGAAFLGVDRSLGSNGVLGVAVSRNQGGVDLDGEGHWAGRVDARLTTVYPYLRWSPIPKLDLWGIVGMGGGDIDLGDRGGDLRTDGSLRMAATGLRGDLARLGAVDLAVRGDAFTVGMEADAVAGQVVAADGRAQRARLMLDASTDWALSSSSRLTPSVEVGARIDAGDAETGPGMEVGGGLAYVNSRLGLDVAARGRWLAMHREEHFGEWGGNLSIRRVPSDPNRGLSFSVEPAWGEDASGIMALWEGRSLRRGDFGFGLGPERADEAWRPDRLDMEVSYGADVFDGRGSLVPFGQLRMMGAGSRHLRVGTGLELAGADEDGPARLRLELAGEQRAQAGGVPGYGAILGLGGPGLRAGGGVLAPFGEVSYEGASGRRVRVGTSLRPAGGELLPDWLSLELLGEAYRSATEKTRYGLVLRGGRAMGLE